MVTMLTRTWSRYFDADRRQLPLFPEWERTRWLAPLPSLGAALALAVLIATGTPWTSSDVFERTAALTEPAVEADEPAKPQYDLPAIPAHIKTAAPRHRLSAALITTWLSFEATFTD